MQTTLGGKVTTELYQDHVTFQLCLPIGVPKRANQRYREGGVFKSSEYVEDDDFTQAWKHMGTGIFVWKDAIDLSSKSNPKCFFHYTGHLAWILHDFAIY